MKAMSADVELSEIAQALEAMLGRFSKDYHIANGDDFEFKRLVVEAKDLLDQELGPVNNFSFSLTNAANDAVRNYLVRLRIAASATPLQLSAPA